jgi:hypothetical protein
MTSYEERERIVKELPDPDLRVLGSLVERELNRRDKEENNVNTPEKAVKYFLDVATQDRSSDDELREQAELTLRRSFPKTKLITKLVEDAGDLSNWMYELNSHERGDEDAFGKAYGRLEKGFEKLLGKKL